MAGDRVLAFADGVRVVDILSGGVDAGESPVASESWALSEVTLLAPVAGAVQVPTGPLVPDSVPPLAAQVAGAEDRISTSSFTPTVDRVSGLPSGAAVRVRVVMLQGPGEGLGFRVASR